MGLCLTGNNLPALTRQVPQKKEKHMNKTENNIPTETDFAEASSYFLTERLPNSFRNMSEEELGKFVSDHLWQPFENWSVGDMWEVIENAARSLHDYRDECEKERKAR